MTRIRNLFRRWLGINDDHIRQQQQRLEDMQMVAAAFKTSTEMGDQQVGILIVEHNKLTDQVTALTKRLRYYTKNSGTLSMLDEKYERQLTIARHNTEIAKAELLEKERIAQDILTKNAAEIIKNG